MSELNRKIAEMRGWTVNKDIEGHWNCVSPDVRVLWRFYQSEADAWEGVPDYEHDLNAAIELFWELPKEVSLTDGEFCYGLTNNQQCVVIPDETPQALATAICEAWLRS